MRAKTGDPRAEMRAETAADLQCRTKRGGVNTWVQAEAKSAGERRRAHLRWDMEIGIVK